MTGRREKRDGRRGMTEGGGTPEGIKIRIKEFNTTNLL